MRLLARTSLVLLASLIASTAQAGNAYLEAGIHLYNEVEFEAALEQLKKATGDGPAEDAQIAMYRGLVRYELGEASAAEVDFKTALMLDPDVQLPRGVSPKVVAEFERIRLDVARAAARNPRAKTAPALPPPPPVVDPSPTATAPATEQPATDVPRQSRSITTAPELDATPLAPTAAELGPKSRSRTGPVVLLASGAALAVLGGIFGLLSADSVDQARAEPFQNVSSDRLQTAQDQALAANVLYGTAAVAGIIGVVTLLGD